MENPTLDMSTEGDIEIEMDSRAEKTNGKPEVFCNCESLKAVNVNELIKANQHNLEMVTAAVAIPFLLTPELCMEDDDPAKGKIISSLIFMSGIITILQCVVGTTLPIVQGGCIGYFTKFITPITVAPAITLIGLSLFKNVMIECSKNYYVSGSMAVLLIIFSQHLRNLKMPLLWSNRLPNGKRNTFPIFQVFPVSEHSCPSRLSGCLGCLWHLNSFGRSSSRRSSRVDVKKRIIEETDWFRIPYPFQWGIPTVSIGAVLGMLCGVLTSTVESIGDYYACASIIQAPVPPEHAMNRGIFMEGLGCVISAIMGTGNASTSYSHNIGTLSVTKVGSRRVIQIAGVIMVGLGLVGKAGAIFVSLPDPILGGMFLFLFPLVMSVGIGTLSEVNLESSRNIFIVSFSIFFGLAVSQWMNYNPGLIDTGTPELDSLLQILLSTGITDEERGLTQRQVAIAASKLRNDTTYDLPFGMGFIKRFPIFKWLPISPTYDKHPITLLNCKSKSENFTSSDTSLPNYIKKTGHVAH
ncbi:Solute carrier family 23 member 2 [Orchesella cincta]|uniref:Solute carrier family 23 member 2 n=1 Tax=Orchesella cincta TaxID=48709 RepID=A0A1D2N2Q0_ORCCI|nr:Solute carrier family 23 member 2 [Orchesella cincta]